MVAGAARNASESGAGFAAELVSRGAILLEACGHAFRPCRVTRF
jgi:hypothetical protein